MTYRTGMQHFAHDESDLLLYSIGPMGKQSMATTHLSSRRCHLLEDLVLGVSFYCLALFNKIEDKMN